MHKYALPLPFDFENYHQSFGSFWGHDLCVLVWEQQSSSDSNFVFQCCIIINLSERFLNDDLGSKFKLS